MFEPQAENASYPSAVKYSRALISSPFPFLPGTEQANAEEGEVVKKKKKKKEKKHRAEEEAALAEEPCTSTEVEVRWELF